MQINKTKTNKLLLVVFIEFITIMLLSYEWYQTSRNQTINTFSQASIQATKTNNGKPLSTLTVMKLTANCNLYVVINPDSVWFDPFENVCSNNSFSIEKSRYPELFKQGIANSSFISVEKTNNEDLTLIVSNNQPDHGGYLPVYQLTVNLKTREVKENGSGESNCAKQLVDPSNNNVVKFAGTPRPVDFTTWPEAKKYFTVITEAVAKGSNFSGHYTLAYWGCGTDCYAYAVVETNTGKIIAFSPANGNYHLGNFDINSSVFTLEPVNAGQERKYYKLTEEGSKSHLDVVCTETSTRNMYTSPE